MYHFSIFQFNLQGFGIGTCCGKIMMMNVNKDSMPIELNITNPPSSSNFMASPHGISTWKDEKTGIERGVSCLFEQI